jgi:ribosomal-protein-alanine N-acetyltransferase
MRVGHALILVPIWVFNSCSAGARTDSMLTLPVIRTIETPNLILRELRRTDGPDLVCFMTQPRYQRFIAHRLKDEDAVFAFVSRQIAVQGDTRRNVFHLVAEERHSAEVIGDGFLICHPDKTVEIGWGLHPALWRVGFGTEIGRALVALGFERLKGAKVWCKVMRANTASACLAKRIGMVHAETRDNFPVGHGRFEQVDFYSIDAESYFNLPY